MKRIKQFFNNACEWIVYWSFKRILLGYAAVFAAGLFHLEGRQDKFESQVKVVAADHWKHLNELHQRVLKLENK
jgi:hypothetical protein